MTDTQANIRESLKSSRPLILSVSANTIKVFSLKYADAKTLPSYQGTLSRAGYHPPGGGGKAAKQSRADFRGGGGTENVWQRREFCQHSGDVCRRRFWRKPSSWRRGGQGGDSIRE